MVSLDGCQLLRSGRKTSAKCSRLPHPFTDGPLLKPNEILDYNHTMGGVDLLSRKGKGWSGIEKSLSCFWISRSSNRKGKGWSGIKRYLNCFWISRSSSRKGKGWSGIDRSLNCFWITRSSSRKGKDWIGIERYLSYFRISRSSTAS